MQVLGATGNNPFANNTPMQLWAMRLGILESSPPTGLRQYAHNDKPPHNSFRKEIQSLVSPMERQRRYSWANLLGRVTSFGDRLRAASTPIRVARSCILAKNVTYHHQSNFSLKWNDGSFGSLHTGGCQFSRADGSVQFMTQSVDMSVLPGCSQQEWREAADVELLLKSSIHNVGLF